MTTLECAGDEEDEEDMATQATLALDSSFLSLLVFEEELGLDFTSSLATFDARSFAKHRSLVWLARPQKEHSTCLLSEDD